MAKYELTNQQVSTIKTLLAQGAQSMVNDCLNALSKPLPEPVKKEPDKKEIK